MTDDGKLYQILNYDQPAFTKTGDGKTTPEEIQPNGNANVASLQYIATIDSDQNPGAGVAFAGLTAGPPDVENGEYANMLFAVSQTGDVYALTLTPI